MKTWFWFRLLSLTGAMAGLSLATSAPAQAASFSFNLKQATGDPAEVKITLDDERAGAGNLLMQIDVAEGYIGDIRGIFFNLTDDSLLSGLSITGKDVTSSVLGGAKNTGGGNNMNGASSDPFDIAVEIGNAGIGSSSGGKGGKGGKGGSSSTGTVASDIRSTSLLLSHKSAPLTLSLFNKQNFGVRLMSVGTNREGSSKLAGTVSLPALPSEPPKEPTAPQVNEPAPQEPTQPKPLPVAELPPPQTNEPKPLPVTELPPPQTNEPKPEVNLPPAPPMEEIYSPVHGEFPDDRPAEPVEVPEPGTAVALALGGIAAFKGLKRKGAAAT